MKIVPVGKLIEYTSRRMLFLGEKVKNRKLLLPNEPRSLIGDDFAGLCAHHILYNFGKTPVANQIQAVARQDSLLGFAPPQHSFFKYMACPLDAHLRASYLKIHGSNPPDGARWVYVAYSKADRAAIFQLSIDGNPGQLITCMRVTVSKVTKEILGWPAERGVVPLDNLLADYHSKGYVLSLDCFGKQ